MQRLVFSAALAALAVSGAACASTVGVGFTNVGIHAGDGLNMSLPGGYITAEQSLGDGYAVSGKFTGAGGKNDATFYAGHAQIGKTLNIGGGMGTITPALRMGFQSFNTMGLNLQAATAMVHVGYLFPVNRHIALYAGGGFGRDFETSVTSLQTIGGLMYTADAGADFKIGPGIARAGFQYQHLPLSHAAGLHLNTDEFSVGYRVVF